MVARFYKDYISKLEPKWVASLVATIAKYNHLIDCDNELRQLIENCVDLHCGTIDKEIVLNATLYDITKIKREYLTTIHVDGSLSVQEYLNLFGKPSLVLMENGPYEWPVYVYMIDAYKHDRRFKTIYTIMLKAISGPERTLQEFGAGGSGGIIINLNHKESTPEYSGITRYKIFTVTDSDLDAKNGTYRPTPKSIFQYLSGPEYRNCPVDRRLIDTLNQPHYHWHMWKKRAIENYFGPD